MEGKRHILAIHGAGMHAGVWGSLAAGMDLPFQAVSLPGHGKAAGPLLPSIDKMSAWVRKKLGEFSQESVILLGHSMGAAVALEAAGHSAVAGVVLLGAAAHMPVHPELLHQAKEDPDTAVDMILKWGISPVHPQASHIRTVMKAQMEEAMPGALLNDLAACNDWQSGEAAAEAVRVPALVLAGTEDRLTKPAAGQTLSAILPHGQFHLVKDGGHMLMVERPVETASEINGFAALL